MIDDYDYWLKWWWLCWRFKWNNGWGWLRRKQRTDAVYIKEDVLFLLKIGYKASLLQWNQMLKLTEPWKYPELND